MVYEETTSKRHPTTVLTHASHDLSRTGQVGNKFQVAVALIIHAAMLAMEVTATSDRVGCGDWQVPYPEVAPANLTDQSQEDDHISQSVVMRTCSVCASGHFQRFIVICRFGPPKLSLHHFLCNGQYRLTCCWRGLLLAHRCLGLLCGS